jgi:hypothetical protein
MFLTGAALSLWAACQPAPAPPTAGETPERQFILSHLQLEERRDGRVLWQGTGTRGDGDLSVSDVTDLVLVRKPQTPSETEITIHAVSGHLAFDAGTAHFTEPRVSEPSGGVLTATTADYDEARGELVADGPLAFNSPTAHVLGTRGVVRVREGSMEIIGPVSGRLEQRRGGNAVSD